MLVDRVKTLEAELVDARSSLLEARKSEASLQEESVRLRAALDSSSALVSRLEADLELKLSGGGGSSKAGAGKRAADVGLAELLASDLDASPHATMSQGRLSQASRASSSSSLAGAAGAGGDAEADEGMVHVLQGQRDRYKERLAQAELDLKATRQKLQLAINEKTQLEADNVALYQKIRCPDSFILYFYIIFLLNVCTNVWIRRYLQSGAGGRASSDFFGSDRAVELALMEAGVSAASAGGQGAGDEEGGGGSSSGGTRLRQGGTSSIGVESKYRKLYEEKISPFTQVCSYVSYVTHLSCLF
jgi:hypothetical protein